MTQSFAVAPARRIGAAAGLAPAIAVVVLLVVVGTAPTSEALRGVAVITIVAVGAGWLIGPRATGSSRSDLWAAVAYALAGSVAYVLVGTVVSVWTGPAIEGEPAAAALAARLAGQLLYGLLYLPLLTVGIAPFGILWVVAVRVLRRRAGVAPVGTSAEQATSIAASSPRIDPRRMGLLAALVIAAYGLFVAVLPLVIYHEPRPPWWIERPIVLIGLFSVPAWVAAIGTLRGVRPLVVAAGIICLLQSYVAFSGVTIGFIVPAAVLLWAASVGSAWAMPSRPVTVAAGVTVIVLTVAAWVAFLSLTEPRCWTGDRAADGTINIVEVPATDANLHGPMEISSGGGGCSSAELTIQGMGVSAAFAIGAIALAAAATLTGRKTDPD